MSGDRTATCPICPDAEAWRGSVSLDLFGFFRAATDEELFGKIANHVIKAHGGGPADAFNTAEDVLPWVGARYRRELAGPG